MEAMKKIYGTQKRQKSVITCTANMTNTFNITPLCIFNMYTYVCVHWCTMTSVIQKFQLSGHLLVPTCPDN